MRILALLITALLPALASAQSLDVALGQFQRGEVDAALTSFEALRAAGEQEPAELARIERHLGILYASLGEDERALSAFERSLAIAPDQTTPQEIASEQQANFEATRQARAGASMDVPATRAGDAYRIRVVGAPAGWITRLEASYGGRAEESNADVMELTPSAAEWLGEILVVRIVARDEHGNVVLRRRVELEREVPVAEPASRRGLILGVVLASVLVVAGGVVAAVLVAKRDPDGFQEGGGVMWELGGP